MLNSSFYPNEVQVYAINRDGKLIYAQTANMRISRRAVMRQHRQWLAWSYGYHGGSNKARRQSVAFVGVHTIKAQRDKTQWFEL